MEEYVWISKLAHHPVFVSRAHPVLKRLEIRNRVRITIDGPDDDSDEDYLNAFNNAVQRRVSGIMLIGWQKPGIVEAIDAAVDSGIPVVTVDSDVPGSKRLAHVGTDWFRMGGAMADRLAHLMGRHGNILMIGMRSLANMEAGFQGFRQRMETYKDIELLGLEDDMDTGPDRAEAIVTEYLQKHADLRGIAGFDGNSGPGAAVALQKAGVAQNIKLVCVDADKEQIEHIRTNAIDAAFCQKREAFTYMAFQYLYAYNHGTLTTGYKPGIINIPGNIDTGTIVVTSSNLELFESELNLDDAIVQHELSQQVTLLSSMIENTAEIALAADIAGKVVYANPAAIREYGYPDAEIERIYLEKLFFFTDHQKELISKCVNDGQRALFETTAIKWDGGQFPVQISLSPLRTNSTIRGLVVLAINITKRKKAEEEMKASEGKYKALTEQSNNAIFLLVDERFELVNPKFERLFGITRDEVCSPGFNFMDIVAPESRQSVAERIAKLKSGDEKSQRYEFTAITRSMQYLNLEASMSQIKYRSGIASQGILTDITARRRLEDQLHHAQKMEAVGRLAGGIAHDFNNVLTVISNRSEIAMMTLRDHDPLKAEIIEIQSAVEHAAELTSKLLAFSRKQQMEPKVIDLNSIIIDLEKMLRRIIGEQLKFNLDLREDLWRVKVDKVQIEQVVINLAINAKDAMSEVGSLTIKTDNTLLDEWDIPDHDDIKPGYYVMLSVRDTGTGIPQEVVTKIFEPFFTTKGAGKGTGLGLSTVYGIVKQSCGSIFVDSVFGKGTTFRVYLPKIEEKLHENTSPDHLIDEYTGSETILVVEDDDEVRSATTAILEKQGYNIVSAKAGVEALKIALEHRERIHLVLSDVIMPGMSGIELTEKLRGFWPGIKVIYMSGYPSDDEMLSDILVSETPYLQKPFKSITLAQRVRSVLDAD